MRKETDIKAKEELLAKIKEMIFNSSYSIYAIGQKQEIYAFRSYKNLMYRKGVVRDFSLESLEKLYDFIFVLLQLDGQVINED